MDIVRDFGYLTLGTRLKRLGERLQAEAQRLLGALDERVAVGQYPFLAALDNQGPLGIGELAQVLGITQPGVTRSIAQLMGLGLVEAGPAPADQRRRVVTLTAQGRHLVDAARREAWPRIEAAVADLCRGLSGPLLDQLTAIEDGLTAMRLDHRATMLEGNVI